MHLFVRSESRPSPFCRPPAFSRLLSLHQIVGQVGKIYGNPYALQQREDRRVGGNVIHNPLHTFLHLLRKC